MRLSQSSLDEFAVIFEKYTGKTITIDEAAEIGENLVTLLLEINTNE